MYWNIGIGFLNKIFWREIKDREKKIVMSEIEKVIVFYKYMLIKINKKRIICIGMKVVLMLFELLKCWILKMMIIRLF